MTQLCEEILQKIVEMVRKQGAKNVYFASAAPPVTLSKRLW